MADPPSHPSSNLFGLIFPSYSRQFSAAWLSKEISKKINDDDSRNRYRRPTTAHRPFQTLQNYFQLRTCVEYPVW